MEVNQGEANPVRGCLDMALFDRLPATAFYQSGTELHRQSGDAVHSIPPLRAKSP